MDRTLGFRYIFAPIGRRSKARSVPRPVELEPFFGRVDKGDPHAALEDVSQLGWDPLGPGDAPPNLDRRNNPALDRFRVNAAFSGFSRP
jgi:hypothetical protein